MLKWLYFVGIIFSKINYQIAEVMMINSFSIFGHFFPFDMKNDDLLMQMLPSSMS